MAIAKTDHMQYWDNMEIIESDVMDTVLKAVSHYDYSKYTAGDVRRALQKDYPDIEDFGALLSPAAVPYMEEMAQKAQIETRKHFGNAISLFAPLYIANYCENHCVYCGFSCHNRIKRGKLTLEEIEDELKTIATTGLQDILLLTGESRKRSSLEYIGEAVKLAAKYFKLVGIEIYPLNTDEYRFLHKCGADYVCIYQETYNPDRYEKLHVSGPKRVYPYRFNAHERALRGGMRAVSFGALLGLADFRKDAFATGLHAYLVQQKYPQGEIVLASPRLRPFINHEEANPNDVRERQLLQVILAYRLFLPFATISLSTRESAKFRDNVMGIAATKMSAGVKTSVGGYDEEEKGDEQFEISDSRSVDEVKTALKKRGLQPVFVDYVRV
jgi:2-iminoacetate synthase